MRGRSAVFAAVAIHGAILTLVASRPLPQRSPIGEIPLDVIDLEEPPPPPAAPPVTAGSAEPGSVSASRVSATRPALHEEPAAPGERGEAAPAEVAIGVTAPPAGSAAPIALGIAGSAERNPFLPTKEEAPRRDADPKAAERSVRDALHAHDRAIGLAPEGPLLSALRDATYDSRVPPRGRAVFVALLDKLGTIVELHVEGGGAAWGEVRERAVKTLAAKKMTMRGAGPVELRIEVVSDVTLPSGAGQHVSPAASASKVEVPDNAKLGAGAGDVVQTWTVGTFDLSDIGATRRQVVHARVVSSRAM